MDIGILALQGAFREHEQLFNILKVKTHNIRKPADLELPLDGLVIPGGESTAIAKMLVDFDMLNPIKRMILAGLPVFGTCAGLILLAKETTNNGVSSLNTMNITARRNAYGRQLSSFTITGQIADIGAFPMVFIRAPYIENVGEGVETMAIVEGKIVAARENNQLATAFHPELTQDTRLHELFINMCQDHQKSKA
jgi:5'-phosphate synthase pdxT subunit